MKKLKLITIVALVAGAVILLSFNYRRAKPVRKKIPFVPPKGCVFQTVMGEESSDSNFVYKTPIAVQKSVDHGLTWLISAQNKEGGWGAGSHSYQKSLAPKADPATTAMAAMALLRTGSNLDGGPYRDHVASAVHYLLENVENSNPDDLNITTLRGTQIQVKLGANIDVILTAQLLANLTGETSASHPLNARIKNALDICVSKIQRAQANDGSISGSGWAGVLQSSFATNALETAQAQGAKVDDESLERARQFQKENVDTETGNVKTEAGAGIILYSVTGSARAAAKQARKVKEDIDLAKQTGALDPSAPVTPENLERIGYGRDEALKMSTSYKVYASAKERSQDDAVMRGFGNNGGEEFLSYLQTGESMIIGKDESWTRWYDNIGGRLLKIQNDDGSWNGHHCITSPVFCTATCLLILSVNNDIEKLVRLGASK